MSYLRTIVIESVALVGSLGTLLCCAMPALLVSIGAGAAVATLITTIPQLIWLSEHKVPLFILAAVMLVISGVTMYLNRRMACPTDPAQAKSCRRMRRFAASVFFTSLGLYVVGFYFAFIASHIAT